MNEVCLDMPPGLSVWDACSSVEEEQAKASSYFLPLGFGRRIRLIDPSLWQPQVEAGRAPSWKRLGHKVGSPVGWARTLPGQVSVGSEAGAESATEGLGQGQVVL